jgi:hypothetical protein
MNQKRGAHSAIETIPGGVIASVIAWAWSLTPLPPMPLEIALALATIGGALSSYLIGRHRA